MALRDDSYHVRGLNMSHAFRDVNLLTTLSPGGCKGRLRLQLPTELSATYSHAPNLPPCKAYILTLTKMPVSRQQPT
jgi:hypothetical protein